VGMRRLRGRGLTRRDFLRAGGAGLAGMALFGASAACGGGGGGGQGGGGDGGGEMVMWTRETSAALIKPVVDRFNENNEGGTRIRLTSINPDQFSERFSTALASDEAPDLVSIDLVLVPYFSSIGAFKDVTETFESLDFRDSFNDAMVRLGQREGTQYAFPFSADVSALVYNRGHFEQAGLDPDSPPTTWQELREAARELTNGERFGYVYSGGDAGGHMFTFMPYVWGNGGEYLNEDGTQALIDGPEAVEALEFFTQLTREDEVTPSGVVGYNFDQFTNAFATERASMMVNGNFTVNLFNTDYPDLDFGVALVPKNEGREHSSFSGGELIAIPASSQFEEQALEFIRFALSEEVQVEAWAKNGVIPVRNDFFENRYFEEEPKYKVFAEALNVAECPYTTKYYELYNPLLTAMQNALRGEQSPQAAFSRAKQEMDRILQS